MSVNAQLPSNVGAGGCPALLPLPALLLGAVSSEMEVSQPISEKRWRGSPERTTGSDSRAYSPRQQNGCRLVSVGLGSAQSGKTSKDGCY